MKHPDRTGENGAVESDRSDEPGTPDESFPLPVLATPSVGMPSRLPAHGARHDGPSPLDGSAAGDGAVVVDGAARTPVAPSRTDPIARFASEVVGGPAGDRLGPATGFWRALPVLILLAVAVFGLGVVQKQHCREAGWKNPDLYWHACYSDIPVLYGSVGLAGENRPGLVQAVSDGKLGPPLEGVVMWTASVFVDDTPASRAPRRYFDLSAVLLAGALVGLVVVVVRSAGRRPWDAAHVALSPVLVTIGLVSYDLLAVALAAGGLLAWARRRPLTAGVLIGLAAATRPMTAVVGLAVLAVALRAGRWAPAFDGAGAAVLAWLGVRALVFPGLTVPRLALAVGAVVLVAVVASRLWSLPGVGLGGLTALALVGTTALLDLSWGGLGLAQSWQVWKGADPGYGSVWMIPKLLIESQQGSGSRWPTSPMSAQAATVAALLGMMAVAIIAVGLALAAPRRPRVASLALLLAAGFLVVGKAIPVQASLLLLPLIALAGLRWRDHLLWAASEVAYFVGIWLYIAGVSSDRGLPAVFYLVLLLWRLSMIGWLAVRAGRHVLDPRGDPVRAPEDGSPGADDPLGGPAEGAGDALIVRLA